MRHLRLKIEILKSRTVGASEGRVYMHSFTDCLIPFISSVPCPLYQFAALLTKPDIYGANDKITLLESLFY